MQKYMYNILWLAAFLTTSSVYAEDELELDTTFIKGNKELPQMMYIVPWQDMKTARGKKAAQDLTLHSLFGDIFDPMLPTNNSLSYSE